MYLRGFETSPTRTGTPLWHSRGPKPSSALSRCVVDFTCHVFNQELSSLAHEQDNDINTRKMSVMEQVDAFSSDDSITINAAQDNGKHQFEWHGEDIDKRGYYRRFPFPPGMRGVFYYHQPLAI